MLDFQKAFDTIEWRFLFKTLEFFNFGPSFIKWIETIYHRPEECLKNNDFFSDHCDIKRAIRQGCPASCLLFVLCVEVLDIKIRTNNSLKGYHLGNEHKTVKLAQYADDCISFLNNRAAFCSALNIREIYGNLSGLILNIETYEGL